ncbi:MAG: hypothetical protein KJT03_04505, partial [Verrucomicrobiae bacterium]|nr:hypothetical protein [Verrucomicrobiae bacterium]
MFFSSSPKLSSLLFALTLMIAFAEAEEVYFGNGIKIGEVSDTEAIIWTRLTSVPDPVQPGAEFIVGTKQQPIRFANFTDEELGPRGGYGHQLPEGVPLEKTAFAVPGESGVVRLTYEEVKNPNTRKTTSWQAVDPDRDFTRHFNLRNLKPDTDYALTLEARKSESSDETTTLKGSFATAPSRTTARKVTFAVTTCMAFSTLDDGDRGQLIYKSMLKLKPDFFVHAGDIVYYDHKDPFVTHIDLARHKWNRMFGLSNLKTLLTQVPAYW